VAGQCTAQPASSCGNDGTCDGAGGCRKHPDGTACGAGRCEDGAVVSKSCSGGACQESAPTPCAPYACDEEAGKCFASCRNDKQCQGRGCSKNMCGVKNLGAECSNGDECASGFCADGVCCNLACTDACVACDQPGNMGSCMPVAEGADDPNGVCRREPPETCGQDGRCNGAGACTKHPAGTICKGGSCRDGTQLGAGTCSGEGACQPASPVSCAPFVCGATVCKDRCAGDEDCVGDNVCVDGSCGRKQNGRACKQGSECRSDFCVDGVCCESACTDSCTTCASPTAPGRCVSIAAGLPDPRGICVDHGPGSCGENGRCNGNRGCATYPNGTVCGAGGCDATTDDFTPPSVCKDGACTAAAPRACAPFKCAGALCATTCSRDEECTSLNVCREGSCGKKPIGALCTRDDECGGRVCSQGVCCSSTCNGSCISCALPGSMGVCVPVPPGTADPAGGCRDEGAASCGNDGTCNGWGGCRKYLPGTVCVAASCTGGIQRLVSTCDGAGHCTAGAERACDPYTCNATTGECFDSCAQDQQCAAPNRCDIYGQCGKKYLGAKCAEASECASGFCIEGVCCDRDCRSLCKSCAVTGAVGICTNVPGGAADPRGGCTPTAQTTCGNDGTCDGRGSCRNWTLGTPCRQGYCAGSTSAVSPATCDGNGTCPTPEPQACGAYQCDLATGACRMSCAEPGDCAADKSCVASTCQ
jgi:hypothetical protein